MERVYLTWGENKHPFSLNMKPHRKENVSFDLNLHHHPCNSQAFPKLTENYLLATPQENIHEQQPKEISYKNDFSSIGKLFYSIEY